MNVAISSMICIALTILSVITVYLGINEKGPLILQKIGKGISTRTWSLILISELNIASFSWFSFFLLEEMPFNTPSTLNFETSLNIFLIFSLLSVLVILVRRRHIKPPYRTLETDLDLLEFELEKSENQPGKLDEIVLRHEANSRISKTIIKKFLSELSTRDDELGIKAREHLATRKWE